jgi:ectoine hydroxylase-related dioxygenase (phytanoyl-CoA dioxygenase family)
MTIDTSNFDSNGYVLVENVLSYEAVTDIERQLESMPNGGVGTRNLLATQWCKQLARTIAIYPLISVLLPESAVAVQCTYFTKSLKRNWLVPLHQDYVIPLKRRFFTPGWSMWSVKEGVHYARPPDEILGVMVAVRVHLEENTLKNGPLQVIAGSHRSGSRSETRITCLVAKGGALVMRPLISTHLLRSSRDKDECYTFYMAQLYYQAQQNG